MKTPSGKVFGGRITMVWWLAGLLLRSSPFLSSRSSVSASLRAALLSRLDEVHPLRLGKWAGRQEVQLDNFESPVLSNIVQEAVYIAVVSPPIRSSARGQRISRTPSGVPQQVRQQQLLYSLPAAGAQQDAEPVLAALLVVPATGTRQ